MRYVTQLAQTACLSQALCQQVEESSPLEAVKAILAAVNQAVPVSMTSKSRGTTSIHEWWGLHCSDDHGIRMCLELLPNAAQLLGKGLKFFKSGSHNPAGVRVTREQVPRAIPLIWPAWYQKEMDAVKALGMCQVAPSCSQLTICRHRSAVFKCCLHDGSNQRILWSCNKSFG